MGTGKVVGAGLVAVLCAGALAPVVTADAGLGAPEAAIAGLVGSIGGNVIADLLTTVAQRLRGSQDATAAWDEEAVEQALVKAVEQKLANGGAAGAAMREFAAAILKEAGAVQAVLAGAASADPHAAEALAVGLAELGQQFGEFAAVAADLRVATADLQRELAATAAERRETAGRDQQLMLVTGRLVEALDTLAAGSAFGEPPVWPQCPYPGLGPFSEADARVFFGRRGMTRRLVQAVAVRARTGGLLVMLVMLVMLGASGAGQVLAVAGRTGARLDS